MADISAKTVKELRDKTGVGMMECKKALEATNGDMEAAIEELRKAGITKAEKKAHRTAKEGRVLAQVENGVAVLAEVLCETDFVAKTDDFQEFTAKVVACAVAQDADGCVSEAVAEATKADMTALIGKVGENMQVRRVARWKVAGTCSSYLHMGGKIGVLAEVDGEADEELLHDLCLHIAAFNPSFIAPADVPADLLAKEREIAEAQVVGKPANIIDKIVSGKISKWYTEVCLVQQPWVKDDKQCFAKIAPKVTVKRFLRWQVGEEI
jgi:elongation factor Ts